MRVTKCTEKSPLGERMTKRKTKELKNPEEKRIEELKIHSINVRGSTQNKINFLKQNTNVKSLPTFLFLQETKIFEGEESFIRIE